MRRIFQILCACEDCRRYRARRYKDGCTCEWCQVHRLEVCASHHGCNCPNCRFEKTAARHQFLDVGVHPTHIRRTREEAEGSTDITPSESEEGLPGHRTRGNAG